MMESDVDGLIGAGRHERAEQRTIWRNGYRDRSLDTRLGTLNLKVPKLRQGSYFLGVPRSPQDLRAGLGGRDTGSLDWRRFHKTR
jgi:transposase-like protein